MTELWLPRGFCIWVLAFSPCRYFLPGPSPGEWALVAAAPFLVVALFCSSREGLPSLTCLMLLMMAALTLSTFCRAPLLGWFDYKMLMQWMLQGALFGWFFLWLSRETRPRTQGLIRVLIHLGAGLGALGTLQMVIGPSLSASLMPWGPEWTLWYSRLEFRVYGFFDNPLLHGAFLTMLWPLALVGWLEAGRDGRRSLWDLLALALIVAGILFSGSRSCILVALLCTGMIFMSRTQKGGPILAMIFLAPIVLAIFVSPVGDRFTAVFAMDGDGNLNQRIEAAAAGWAMLADRPLLGTGPGQFAHHYYQHYKPVATQEHASSFTLDNLIFQMACEVGFPFAALAFIAFFWTLLRAWRLKSDLGPGVFWALMAFAVLSLGVALFATPVLWLLLLLFAIVDANAKAI